MNFDGSTFVLILTVYTFFTTCTTEANVQVKTRSGNRAVNIQFSNTFNSISCQLADYKNNIVYLIKFSKEINGSYLDIVDVHKKGEKNCTKWFPDTDLPSRSSNVGSDLNTAKLVLNLHSSTIKESDNGVYKCEFDTVKGSYSDTLTVDWREGKNNSSIRHSESALLYLTAFLLAKINLY
ncbi:uncharacterized protein LOC143054289 [Mytilus galloprovincialis]|uniref:uncharacterized protein LOC143054289 n=1 Tax=Mytilus galloprovincialis TaxID=29158 RepID=UPI003F7C77F6